MNLNGVSATDDRSEAGRMHVTHHVLALFLWLTLTLLGGAGAITARGPLHLAASVTAALTVLTAGALLGRLLWQRPRIVEGLSFSSFVLLALLPLLPPGIPAERAVLLDLYYVLLVCTASFLRLWSWRLQLASSLIALLGATIAVQPGNWIIFVQSLLLIGVAGTLSTAVLYMRSIEAERTTQQIERQAYALLSEAARDRLPGIGWSAILLEAGLLTMLIFLDVTLRGDMLSQPLLAKVYGLIALVFGSLLMKASRPDRLPKAFGLTTIAVGVVLSIARLGYAELQSVTAALPLLYLACLVTVLPFAFELQLVVLWALLFNDLLIKILATFAENGPSFEAVGMMFQQQRGELAILALGATATAGLARALYAHRLQNISHFVDRNSRPQVSGDELQSEEPVPLPGVFQQTLRQERRRSALYGLFLTGVPASLFIAELLFTIPGASINASIAAAGSYFVLWGLLFAVERRTPTGDIFWLFAALLALAVLLVPCILLLISPDAGAYWFFWPVLIYLGLSLVPWRGYELVPLLLVILVAAVELVYHLRLGFIGIGVLGGCVLLSVLSLRNRSERLKQRLLLLAFPEAVAGCERIPAVANALAECLAAVFESGSAIVLGVREPVLVRNGMSYRLKGNVLDVGQLSEARDVDFTLPQARLAVLNWLRQPLYFFDRRAGIVAADHLVLLRLELPEEELPKGGSVVGSFGSLAAFIGGNAPRREWLILLPRRIPGPERPSSAALEMCSALVRMAQSRLAYLEERRRMQLLETNYEARFSDREYELGALVHDVNNTVQDLTLLCESILEEGAAEHRGDGAAERLGPLDAQVRRIAEVARSVATVLSDAKRKRELEKLSDLEPRELVEVTQVLREIVSYATLRAERKRITVELPQLADEKVWVRVSVREHLETILRNLLNNATLYSNPGATVTLGFHTDEHWVTIQVTDTGPGLGPEEQEAIFRSGYRGKSASGVPGGLGLGLAESRRVAESAGGSLEVYSAGEGKGSTFTVRLPRQAAPPALTQGQPWALLVDDQAALTEFYSRLAKALQFVPAVAGSVAEALTHLEARGAPAFVITDIHLGADSGLDLVRTLRARFGNALPILVVSGMTADDVSEQARLAGATDFVAKPVGRRALFARIQSLLPLGSEQVRMKEL